MALALQRTTRVATRSVVRFTSRVEGLGRFSMFAGRVLYRCVSDVILRLRFHRTAAMSWPAPGLW